MFSTISERAKGEAWSFHLTRQEEKKVYVLNALSL